MRCDFTAAATPADAVPTCAASSAHVTLPLRHGNAQLIAEVADPGDRPPVADPVMSADAEGGRGLFIVGELSKTWDYCLLPTGGKVVWCVIALA